VLKRALVGLGLGLAAGLVALAFGQLEFASRMEDASYDLRVRQTARPVAAPSPVVIVEINEASIQALEPTFGRWPWPRLVHSGVINYLKRAGATVIAYDVTFGEHDAHSALPFAGRTVTGDESDQALVAAVRDAGNVVLSVNATFEDVADPSKSIAKDTNLIWPGTSYAPGDGFRERPDVRYGLTALCVGMGMGAALLWENLGASH
jgi:adenylate cyclase